jgi:hypothetical protein
MIRAQTVLGHIISSLFLSQSTQIRTLGWIYRDSGRTSLDLLLEPAVVEVVDHVVGFIEELPEASERSGRRRVPGRPTPRGTDQQLNSLHLAPELLRVIRKPGSADPRTQLADLEGRKDCVRQPFNRGLHQIGRSS